MSFTIRNALPEDAAGMMAVRLSVRENRLTAERAEELGINEVSVVRMLTTTHPGHVAEHRGQIVGFAMADSRDASVFALFIEPDHAGQGLGRALLRASVADLWELGFEQVELLTDIGTRAHEFYQQFGFREVERLANGEVRLRLARPLD